MLAAWAHATCMAKMLTNRLAGAGIGSGSWLLAHARWGALDINHNPCISRWLCIHFSIPSTGLRRGSISERRLRLLLVLACTGLRWRAGKQRRGCEAALQLLGLAPAAADGPRQHLLKRRLEPCLGLVHSIICQALLPTISG